MRLLLAACVAAVLGIVPAASASQWYHDRERVTEGTVLEIPSGTGTKPLTLTIHKPKVAAVKIACVASGTTVFWNAPNVGHDEIRSIVFNCGGTAVTAPGGWAAELEGTSIPLIDVWHIDALEVEGYGMFAGALTPVAGDRDPGGKDNHGGVGDELDAFLFFDGAAKRGGALAGPDGATLTVSGYYRFDEGMTGELF